MTEYNGWTNYHTWNIALWIDNEEPLYRAKIAMLERRKRPVTGETVRLFYRREMGGTTPDITEMRATKENYGRANFTEIAEHWESERLEMLEPA